MVSEVAVVITYDETKNTSYSSQVFIVVLNNYVKKHELHEHYFWDWKNSKFCGSRENFVHQGNVLSKRDIALIRQSNMFCIHCSCGTIL